MPSILKKIVQRIFIGFSVRKYAEIQSPDGKIEVSKEEIFNTLSRFDLIAYQAHELAQRCESRIILYRHTGHLDPSFLVELEDGVTRIVRTSKVFEIFERRICITSDSGCQKIKMTASNIHKARISLEKNLNTLLKFKYLYRRV